MDDMTRHYLITALWSSVDDETPLDENYGIEDIAQESIEQAEKDCKRFMELAGEIKDTEDMELIGHDFWLTRNRHGAGFWDGDYPLDGERLTEISKGFREVYPIVGDDGKIYFE